MDLSSSWPWPLAEPYTQCSLPSGTISLHRCPLLLLLVKVEKREAQGRSRAKAQGGGVGRAWHRLCHPLRASVPFTTLSAGSRFTASHPLLFLRRGQGVRRSGRRRVGRSRPVPASWLTYSSTAGLIWSSYSGCCKKHQPLGHSLGMIRLGADVRMKCSKGWQVPEPEPGTQWVPTTAGHSTPCGCQVKCF